MKPLPGAKFLCPGYYTGQRDGAEPHDRHHKHVFNKIRR